MGISNNSSGKSYRSNRGKWHSKKKGSDVQPTTKPEHVFKFVVSGNYGVGKTSCINRFINDTFNESVSPFTQEVQDKTLSINGTYIQLRCCDTLGQEHYSDMTRSYYRDVHGVFIIFDTTDRRSFQSLDHWIEQLERNSNEEAILYLIGSKIDLKTERAVTFDDAREYAISKKLEYLEISAKTGENVKEAFNELAKLVLGRDNFE